MMSDSMAGNELEYYMHDTVVTGRSTCVEGSWGERTTTWTTEMRTYWHYHYQYDGYLSSREISCSKILFRTGLVSTLKLGHGAELPSQQLCLLRCPSTVYCSCGCSRISASDRPRLTQLQSISWNSNFY